MKKYLIGILVVSLLLVGCLTEEDHEVQKLEIQDKSDLYGVWYHDGRQMCGIAACSNPFYLVLDPDTSFYVNIVQFSEQQSKAVLSPLMMEWTVDEKGFIEISPNWRYIRWKFFQGVSMSSLPMYSNIDNNYDSASVFVFTDLDSVVRAVEIYDSIEDNRIRYTTDYKIIQWNKNSTNEELSVIEGLCYEEHPDLNNYEGYCTPIVLEKDNDFHIETILGVADTMVSTDFWEALLN